jgi:hypothetical protein
MILQVQNLIAHAAAMVIELRRAQHGVERVAAELGALDRGRERLGPRIRQLRVLPDTLEELVARRRLVERLVALGGAFGRDGAARTEDQHLVAVAWEGGGAESWEGGCCHRAG